MVTDPISDILTRIRNASLMKHRIVQIPKTKMSLAISQILKNEGFIKDFNHYQENENAIPYLLLSLKYSKPSRDPVISKIERVSKPGLRVYTKSKMAPKVLKSLGIAILSTSKGVMTNLDANKLGIGGEILCYIW